MPCPDPSLPTYSLTYSISPFTGVTNIVTNVAPGSVIIVPPASPGSTSVVVDPNVTAGIIVSGHVNLDIVITDGSRTSSYEPLGLGVQTASGKASTNVFPKAALSGNTVTLTDYAIAGSSTTYEFVVLFQADNGHFGALDPKISNM